MICRHFFVDGFGLMGDAVTCLKCGYSKYPEVIPIALTAAMAQGRYVSTRHPRWRAYARLAQRAQRHREKREEPVQ